MVIVIVLLGADLLPGLADGREQRLVQQFVPEAPLKLSTKPFCIGLLGAM